MLYVFSRFLGDEKVEDLAPINKRSNFQSRNQSGASYKEDYTQKELEDFLSQEIRGERSHPKFRYQLTIVLLTLSILIRIISIISESLILPIILFIIFISLLILALLLRFDDFRKFGGTGRKFIMTSGGSMYPTIHDGDILRVKKIYDASVNNLEVGTIITFILNPDQNELAYEKTSNITRYDILCKRIIKIFPEGVYVCGDNEDSLNSDVYGLVPFENIIEKVIYVVGIQKNRNGTRKFFTREIKKTKFVSVQKELDRNEEYNADQYDKEECNLYENNLEEIKSGKSAESYIDIGLSKSESAEYDEAIECFMKALALDKQNPEIYIFIGEIKYKLGAKKEANECFMKALELDKQNPELYKFIGGIKYEYGYEYGEYKEAIDYFHKAITLDDSDPELYRAIGNIKKELGEYEESRQYRKRARTLEDGRSAGN